MGDDSLKTLRRLVFCKWSIATKSSNFRPSSGRCEGNLGFNHKQIEVVVGSVGKLKNYEKSEPFNQKLYYRTNTIKPEHVECMRLSLTLLQKFLPTL